MKGLWQTPEMRLNCNGLKRLTMDNDDTRRTVADWFNEGIRCFNKPDGVGAVRAFETVVEIDPAYRHKDGDNPYFYLGKISEIEGRLSDAIMFYSRALTLDPYDEESLIGRGSCYTVKNNSELAIADFKKVLDIPPEARNVPLEHILYVIAENYRKQKRWSNALYWGEKALAEDPNNYRYKELVSEVKNQITRE
jgi:tetratricopeptide (TPR) repeat protein